jgi:hypothetical protein
MGIDVEIPTGGCVFVVFGRRGVRAFWGAESLFLADFPVWSHAKSMKFLLPAVCAFVVVGPCALAQSAVSLCVPPDALLTKAQQAAFMASNVCNPPNPASPLGPIRPAEPVMVKKEWQAPARETVRIEIPQVTVQDVDVPVAEEQNFGYNYKESMRLGQMDAVQGKAMNMKYASNLGYLKGYTKGQEDMAKNGGGGGFGSVSGGTGKTSGKTP